MIRTNLRLHQKIIFIFLILFFSRDSVFAQTYSMDLSSRRSLSSDWFGLNSQNTMRDGMTLDDPDLLQHLPTLKPKMIRFPSAGCANWWDWKKGWWVDSPYLPLSLSSITPSEFTLEKFQYMVNATGATPIFVLNMISSTLADQLAMLKHADSIGLPVKNVELGEEFYYAEESDSTFIYMMYPTAQYYGTVCTQWIDSIHHYFPQAKVCAQGSFNRNNNERRITWDENMVQTLEGEDAISFHHYYSASKSETQGAGDGLYTSSDIPEFLYRPFESWDVLADEDLPTVRPGREIWITEYNLTDNSIPVHGTWGHGLFVATKSLLFLEDYRINHIVFHTMDGTAVYGAFFNSNNGFDFGDNSDFVEPPVIKPTTAWSLTAAGEVLNLISESADGMNNASELSFGNIPPITFVRDGETLTYPAVYGWQFSNANGSSAIIVNLSATEIKVNTTDVFPAGGTFNRYAQDPLAYITDVKNLTHKQDALGATLTLKGYSIVEIKSASVPPPPPAQVTISVVTGTTTFCDGDSVQLDAGPDYYKYLWSNGKTTRKVWIKNTGDFWVRAWGSENGYWVGDTMHVQVNPIPVAPIIVSSGKTEFCDGGSVILMAKNPKSYFTYIWSNNVTDTDITVSAAGNYYVTLVDSNGCSAKSTKAVIKVNPLPQPVITAQGATSFCDGKSVTLSAPYGFDLYQWSNNKWGKDMLVKTAGSFYVTVTDFNKCVGTSSPITTVVHDPPKPTITVTGPTAFCTGTSPTYFTTIQGYDYVWKKGSKAIAGATDYKYYPTQNGTFTVTITDEYGCTDKSSSTGITVLDLPKSTITIAGSKNICNGDVRVLSAYIGIGYVYQWMKNGVNIPLAILPAYTATTAGDYQCKATNASGCSKISNTITITSNCKSLEEETTASVNPTMNIYPNPSSGNIHIHVDFTHGENESATLEIRNLLGELMYTENNMTGDQGYNADLLLGSGLTNGIYLASVKCGDQFVMKTFIIER